MKKESKYITVLDFEDGKVFQYEVPAFNDHEKYEEYLTNEGHNLTNCEWMVHENPNIHRNYKYIITN